MNNQPEMDGRPSERLQRAIEVELAKAKYASVAESLAYRQAVLWLASHEPESFDFLNQADQTALLLAQCISAANEPR
jgi:hypothetical protein